MKRHCPSTSTKNLFSFEIFGLHGKLEVTGLGGSYGTERLAHYAMRPEMGPPDTIIWEYPRPDGSWEAEFGAFVEDVKLARQPAGGLDEARAALRIVERVYVGSSA